MPSMFKFYLLLAAAVILTLSSYSLKAEITFEDLADAVRHARSCPAEAEIK